MLIVLLFILLMLLPVMMRGCVNDTQSAFMSIMLSVEPLRIAISVRDWQYTGAQIRCFIVHHCKFVHAKCEQF